MCKIFQHERQNCTKFDSYLNIQEIPEVYPEHFSLFPAPKPVKQERGEFINELRECGVRVIDILPAFENAKKKFAVFDPYDTHWTSAGIELTAKVISGQIDSALTEKKMSRDAKYTVHDTVFYTCADMRERHFGKGKSELYPLLNSHRGLGY